MQPRTIPEVRPAERVRIAVQVHTFLEASWLGGVPKTIWHNRRDLSPSATQRARHLSLAPNPPPTSPSEQMTLHVQNRL